MRYIDADKLKSEFDYKHIDMNKTAAVVHHKNILEIITNSRPPTLLMSYGVKTVSGITRSTTAITVTAVHLFTAQRFTKMIIVQPGKGRKND